ncbi:MAG: hypothetical protein QXG67_01945 [Candidatus Nitrosotenuis sp.]
MPKGFETNYNHMMLYYMLQNRIFNQRKMADDLGWKFGARVNSFVRWLEESKYIRKTLDPNTGKLAYEVPSRAALLGFYARFRDMSKEKLLVRKIGRDYNAVMKYLSDNGAVMCLTTALQFYDDNFRDITIHAYAENRKLMEIIPRQEEGDIQVNLYAYDFVDKTQKEKGIRITSPIRTIMDLYCNNMAYTAERLIAKEWQH